MITPRQAFLTLEYDGTDISSDIRKDVENFTYTDSGSDSSDSLSIKVNAMDHKWINSWMPDKEAVLHPTLCTTNWIVQGDRTVLDCGTLVVDDLSFSACPDVLTIGAVARPNGTSFHEKNREQVWKNTSIKRIAETIAGRYGLECKMDAEDVSVALKEQDDNDSSFLQKICSTYGLILKTYRNKIWIFDREKYKKKDSVATVKPIDIVPGSLSWNTTLAGTYTGGEFTYSNQKKKVNIKVTIGMADRMLKLNQYASSEADAKRQLQAAIDNKNHSATTISFTTMVCVLHNSDSQEMGTCIGTFWNEDNKPVGGKKQRYRYDYNDKKGKAFEQYDGDSGDYEEKIDGNAKETIGKNLDFTVGGDVTFKVGASTVKVCQSGTIEITGTTVKITGATVNISGGSGDCKINGVSLVNHKHEHDGSAKAGPYTVSGNTGVPVK